MKADINFTQFCDYANDSDSCSYCYESLQVLFDHFEESGIDFDTAFDIMRFDYAEYNFEDLVNDYDDLLTLKEFKEDNEDLTSEDLEDEYKEALLDRIRDNTTLIEVNDDCYIVGDY